MHGVITATSAMLRFGVRRGLLESNAVRLLERGDRPSAKRKKEPRYLDRSEIDPKTEASMQPVPIRNTSASPRGMRASLFSRAWCLRNSVAKALIRTCNGRPQDRHNVGRSIRAAGDATGLNREGVKRLTPHDLRHSCAALLLAAGVPAPKVAAVLRHADARLTMTVYAWLVESQRADLRGDLEAALGTTSEGA